MPHASHRLDLLRVPADLDAPPDQEAWQRLLAAWRADGRLAGSGSGRDGDGLIQGGFRRLWLDDPGRLTLYANQQGGFRVSCPRGGANLAAEFSAALQRWREGADRGLPCPACGAWHALEAIPLSPPGAFARWAVVFSDVGSLELREDAEQALIAALGPLRPVLRRVG